MRGRRPGRPQFFVVIEQLERQVAELNLSVLTALREWFDRYDAGIWDRRIEADAKSGKLDGLVDRALRDHNAGRSTEM